MELAPVNWHVMATNPIDYIGSDRLRTPKGEPVTIEQGMVGVSFTVVVGAARHACDSIQGVAAVLHNLEVCLSSGQPYGDPDSLPLLNPEEN